MAYKPLKKKYMSQYSGPLQKMIDSAVEERVSALKNTEEDLEMVVEGSRAAKKAAKAEKKAADKAEKERKKLLKQFGGDEEKMNAYLEKKAQLEKEKTQYYIDYAEDKYDEQGNLISKGLAGQGKRYVQRDASGDVHAVPGNITGQEAIAGATSRDAAKEAELLASMTEEERAAYIAQKEAEAQEYFKNLKTAPKSEVEGGQTPPLNKKPVSKMLQGRTMAFRKNKF